MPAFHRDAFCCPQIVDKTIIYADKDGDGRVSFDEFCAVRPGASALGPDSPSPFASCLSSRLSSMLTGLGLGQVVGTSDVATTMVVPGI
jgi:hypothetical protein